MDEKQPWYSELADNVQEYIRERHDQLDKTLREAAEDCESPIEQLMSMALTKAIGNDDSIYYSKQETIKANGKEYRVDFLLECYDAIFMAGEPVTDWTVQLIVECDGWQYHSTREQIEHDNERDLDILISSGIPTVRFTGSEIVKSPAACATSAIRAVKRLDADARFERELTIKHAMSIGSDGR